VYHYKISSAMYDALEYVLGIKNRKGELKKPASKETIIEYLNNTAGLNSKITEFIVN